MKAVAFVGFKESGKTEAIINVCRELRRMGIKVGVLKRVHGEIDVKGKDSSRISEVSETVALISSLGKGAVFYSSLDLNKAFSLLGNVDVVLLEGFKEMKTLPKVYCIKEEEELSELEDGLGIAISGRISSYLRGEELRGLRIYDARKEAKDLAELILKKGFMLPGINCGECGEKSCYEMAKKIISGERRAEDCKALKGKAKVIVNGRQIPLKPWVQDLIEKVIRGLISSLKGCSGEEEKIEIIIER